jgi:hypothetical protein
MIPNSQGSRGSNSPVESINWDNLIPGSPLEVWILSDMLCAFRGFRPCGIGRKIYFLTPGRTAIEPFFGESYLMFQGAGDCDTNMEPLHPKLEEARCFPYSIQE